MFEDAAALEDLGDAESRQIERLHAVDALASELDRPLVTSPRSARKIPDIALSVVVLPAPLAPSSVVMRALR